jgi:hypothetical protein
MKESRRSEDAEAPIILSARYPCRIVYAEGFRSRMLDFFQRIQRAPNENLTLRRIFLEATCSAGLQRQAERQID